MVRFITLGALACTLQGCGNSSNPVSQPPAPRTTIGSTSSPSVSTVSGTTTTTAPPTSVATSTTTVKRELTIAPPTVVRPSSEVKPPSVFTGKVHDSLITFNSAEPPLTFPTDTFLAIEKLIEQQPPRHKATLIYFDGIEGSGASQIDRMHEKGLLNGLTDTLRVVAAEMRTTPLNDHRFWFPWGYQPYQIVPNQNLGARHHMEESMRVIMPIIEREARLLGGDYSRIFLLGYSQGGMMASWIGLMSNKPLGGAVNMHGVFPVFDLDQVSEAGKDVIIHHLHDRNDRNVIYENAEKGARAAIAAGARGYKGVIHTEVPGNSHHGFTTKVCGEVNAWFLDVFNRSGLL